jgi:hypothetical protein
MPMREQSNRSRGNDEVPDLVGLENDDAHRQFRPEPASGD